MNAPAKTGKIRLHDKSFTLYISSARISDSISGLASRLNADLQGKNPVFLAVLNGSFLFAADLVRKLTIEHSISFVRVSSYNGMSGGGEVRSILGLSEDVKGRLVVILEDIVDTGNTLEKITELLENAGAGRVMVTCLLYKPEAYKKNRVIDYYGIEVPNEFLVGFGLDYNQAGRNLEDIYILDKE